MEEPKTGKDAQGTGSLTIDDLNNFLVSANGSPECQVCGKNAWDVVNSLDENQVALTANASHQGKNVNVSLKVFPIVCSRCGFVRFHASHIIEAWKNHREEGSEDE